MSIECSACRAPNRKAARFCEECGSPLARSCPSCGGTVGADKRFCGDCGRALNPLDETRSVDQEFRLATIVALRPCGRVGVSEGNTVRELAESLGAVLVDAASDTVLAIFGAPAAQEDHERRAILRAQGAQAGAGRHRVLRVDRAASSRAAKRRVAERSHR